MKINKEKLKVKEYINKNISIYDIDGLTKDQIINIINNDWFSGLDEKFTDVVLDIQRDEGNVDLYIMGQRLETDKEYDARMATYQKYEEQARRNKEKTKAEELKELARLQKKYGKI